MQIMARRLQKDLWKTLRKNLPQVHWQRIEGLSMPGIPDVNGCCNGVEVWIELKIVPYYKIDLTMPQCTWLRKRVEAGGHTYVLAERHRIIRVWRGIHAFGLRDMGWEVISPEFEADLSSDPDWDGLSRILFSKI